MNKLMTLAGGALLVATLVPGGAAQAAERQRADSARGGRAAVDVLTADSREPILVTRPGSGLTAKAVVLGEDAAGSNLAPARRIVVSFHTDDGMGVLDRGSSQAAPTRRNLVMRTVNTESGESLVIRGDGTQIQLDTTR